jgi:hypothetical protein
MLLLSGASRQSQYQKRNHEQNKQPACDHAGAFAAAPDSFFNHSSNQIIKILFHSIYRTEMATFLPFQYQFVSRRVEKINAGTSETN